MEGQLVFHKTPVPHRKTTGRWFNALPEPAVLKQEGEWRKGAGAGRETDHGSRTEKMVSGESLGATEKFLLLYPIKQNGGVQHAAWH